MSQRANSASGNLVTLHDWIEKACSNGAVPVITGMNGDMDTVGSAISLAASNPKMMACGLHLNRISKRVCVELNAPFKKISDDSDLPHNLGGIIVVDAASPSQIGFELPDGVPKCVIDHHDSSHWQLSNSDLMINMDVSATTEIIAKYLTKHSSSTLTEPVRKLLIAGLITDSGRFKHNTKDSFTTAHEILQDSEIEYAGFVEWLEIGEINSSERGSLLKGMQRAKATESGDWSIIHSYCGTLEGRLASLLLSTGYDISLVSRSRDGATRLTARASKKATYQGISLAEIMSNMAEQIGGEGGGHAGAAGWTGNVDRITAESSFIANVAKIPQGVE